MIRIYQYIFKEGVTDKSLDQAVDYAKRAVIENNAVIFGAYDRDRYMESRLDRKEYPIKIEYNVIYEQINIEI